MEDRDGRAFTSSATTTPIVALLGAPVTKSSALAPRPGRRAMNGGMTQLFGSDPSKGSEPPAMSSTRRSRATLHAFGWVGLVVALVTGCRTPPPATAGAAPG